MGVLSERVDEEPTCGNAERRVLQTIIICRLRKWRQNTTRPELTYCLTLILGQVSSASALCHSVTLCEKLKSFLFEKAKQNRQGFARLLLQVAGHAALKCRGPCIGFGFWANKQISTG